MFNTDSKQWRAHLPLATLPELQDLDDAGWRAVCAKARAVDLPAGQTVFKDGDPCNAYLLVTDGCVRVFKLSENGREILLYRVEPGQACVLSTSNLFNGGHYSASALTERETNAIVIPVRAFHEGIDNSSGFRRFVFAEYAGRISELIMLLENVTFGSIEKRLAAWLISHGSGDEDIHLSHRELASELGTAREVVSRQLKHFEHSGLLRLGRKSIVVTDRQALEKLVHCS